MPNRRAVPAGRAMPAGKDRDAPDGKRLSDRPGWDHKRVNSLPGRAPDDDDSKYRER
jgi:hypothetical protein